MMKNNDHGGSKISGGSLFGYRKENAFIYILTTRYDQEVKNE